MPGGVAAKHVMKHSNFTMKYPCVLPQTCRGARDVCAVAHAHTHFFLFFLHTQMYWKSQPSLQIWHIAEDIHRVCHTHACTHTYTWPFDFRVTLKEPFWFFSEISLSCLWCLITLYSKLLQEWNWIGFSATLGACYSRITACMTMRKKRLRLISINICATLIFTTWDSCAF